MLSVGTLLYSIVHTYTYLLPTRVSSMSSSKDSEAKEGVDKVCISVNTCEYVLIYECIRVYWKDM